jgi:hypothetical protein
MWGISRSRLSETIRGLEGPIGYIADAMCKPLDSRHECQLGGVNVLTC